MLPPPLFPCSQFSTKVLLHAGAMDAAVAAATDSHRQQLHTIKAAALANLAWLALQQQNWQQAQQACEAWLQVYGICLVDACRISVPDLCCFVHVGHSASRVDILLFCNASCSVLHCSNRTLSACLVCCKIAACPAFGTVTACVLWNLGCLSSPFQQEQSILCARGSRMHAFFPYKLMPSQRLCAAGSRMHVFFPYKLMPSQRLCAAGSRMHVFFQYKLMPSQCLCAAGSRLVAGTAGSGHDVHSRSALPLARRSTGSTAAAESCNAARRLKQWHT